MPGASFVQDDEGVLQVKVSQSWLNNYQRCPETARRVMLGLVPDDPSDATAIGTALHAGVQARLGGAGEAECLDVVGTTLQAEALRENFQWKQVKTMGTALGYAQNAMRSFLLHVEPELPDVLAVEMPMSRVLAERVVNGQRQVITMTGILDLLTESGVGFHVYDWKTANRPYEAWEVHRYYVQPTVYSFLTDGWLTAQGLEGPVDFTYVVFPKASDVRKPQLIPTERGPGHWAWLERQVWSIVDLWAGTGGGGTPWPLMDQSWYCSEKWCSNWLTCKGEALAMN